MDRFSILTGKAKEKLIPPPEEVKVFGPGNDTIVQERMTCFMPQDTFSKIAIIPVNTINFFKGTETHFIVGTGYIRCKHNICCRNFGTPQYRYGCVIAKYDQNDDEESDSVGYKDTYRLLPWILTRTTWRTLSSIHQTFPIQNKDLFVRSESTDSRRFNPLVIQAAPGECVWASKDEETKNSTIGQARAIFDKLDKVGNLLGKDLSIVEIQRIKPVTRVEVGQGYAAASGPSAYAYHRRRAREETVRESEPDRLLRQSDIDLDNILSDL
jgi:hypothetical protein